MNTGPEMMQSDALAAVNIETDITHESVAAVALLNKSEVEAQLDAAHRYPRQIKRFLNEAITLATIHKEIAASCIYSLPRKERDQKTGRQVDKIITGPSVRLAEIAMSAYGNMQAATRVLDVRADDRTVTAQGVAWDIEKNVRVTANIERRITNRSGQRYNDDMVIMTGNAGASVALRNAIFRVIPRSYIQAIYEAARRVAVGDAKTLAATREGTVLGFQKLGVTRERVLARVGKAALEDVGLTELETLIGLGTAIKSGDLTIEDAFPEQAEGAAKPTSDLEEKLAKSVDAAKKGKATGVAPVAPAKATADIGAMCVVCAKPIEGEGKATWDKDGAEAFRHETCSPFASNDDDLGGRQ